MLITVKPQLSSHPLEVDHLKEVIKIWCKNIEQEHKSEHAIYIRYQTVVQNISKESMH